MAMEGPLGRFSNISQDICPISTGAAKSLGNTWPSLALIKYLTSFAARSLPSSRFAHSVGIIAGGTFVAQFLSIAATPILSRLYTPADYGLIALFGAVSGIVATVLTLRYETAILLPKSEAESATVVQLSLTLALALGTLAFVVAWGMPEGLKSAMGLAALGGWLPIAILAAMGSAVLAVMNGWFNHQGNYKRMARIGITQSAVRICGAIALGLLGVDHGLVTAQIIATLIVLLAVTIDLKPLLTHWQLRALWLTASQHVSAPKYLLPTAFLDAITMQLPVMLLTAWFSTEAAGQFSLAWRVLGLPMGLIGGAVGKVFFQQFAQTWPDVHAARNILFRTWLILGAIGVLPMLMIIFYGEEIFLFILGSAWGESGKIASILAPMLFFMFVSSPTSSIYLVLGLQKYSLIFGFSVLCYRSACLYLGILFDQLYLGLIAWVIMEVIQVIAYNLIGIHRIDRFSEENIKESCA